VAVIKNQIPACFVTLKLTNNSNEVFAVNLLNFTHESILAAQGNLGKISILEGHMLVEIKNKGFLVYRVG
jgi:hypothetical protein